MDRVLDMDEILVAIKQLKPLGVAFHFPPGKVPGTDGLPIEFYHFYKDRLSVLLCTVYQEAFQSKLHLSARR